MMTVKATISFFTGLKSSHEDCFCYPASIHRFCPNQRNRGMEVSSYRRYEFWYVDDQYSLPRDQILYKLVTKAKYTLKGYAEGLHLLLLWFGFVDAKNSRRNNCNEGI